MGWLARVVAAMRVDTGYRVRGLRGVLEIEEPGGRMAYLHLSSYPEIAVSVDQLDGGQGVVHLSGVSAAPRAVSTPLPMRDAAAWARRVNAELRRAMGRGGGWVWPAVLIAAVVLGLWFVLGVAIKFATMGAPAMAMRAGVPTAPGMSGMPPMPAPPVGMSEKEMKELWERYLIEAESEVAKLWEQRRAASGPGEVCVGPEPPSAAGVGTVLAPKQDEKPDVTGRIRTEVPMGSAPQITGFESGKD